MGVAINISLSVMATIIAICAFSYFYRESGSRGNRILMLLMGILASIWCAGYSIMGFVGDQNAAGIWRSVGLFGVSFFMVTELAFVLMHSGAFPRQTKHIVVFFSILATINWLLLSSPDTIAFLRYDYRTCYYSKASFSRTFQGIYLTLLIGFMLWIAARWYRRTDLKRDKRIITTLTIANLSILISCLPDTILPLLNKASFPGSCYGAFVCYIVIWFVSTQLNAFNISVMNLSNYIYQKVNSSILVFDNEHKLAMANNYAHQFLDITAGTRPTLSDLFQISTGDAESLFQQLEVHETPNDIRLIANNNQAVCSISLNMAEDSYGDPYGFICFVYDLTKEEKILSEVNEMKELLQADLKEKTYQVETLTLQSITTIANTIDAKDAYTKGHSIRVSEYSAQLAESLGWNNEAIQNLKYIALLHDIGKISVPDSILNKPDKLTDTEYEIIKSHTTVGGEILKDISMIKDVSDGALYHHERYDGKGYPKGLSGESIPLVARIIGIADAYDAMSSKRIYRNPLSNDVIREELEKGRGTQFDPFLLDQFLILLDEGRLFTNTKTNSTDTIAEESSKLLDQILQNLEQEKARNTQCDYLTGLLNRKAGEEKIIEAMHQSPGALAFVDLDNLKVINDTLGHISGDHAIKVLADVLQNHSHNAIIARVGGDEFLYYIPGADEQTACKIIEGIIHSFRSKKERDNSLKVSSLSIGMCMTKPADMYSDIYQKADKALYYVKQNGKDGYYLYSYADRSNQNLSAVDLKKLVTSLSHQGSYEGSLGVEYREFAKFYEYINNLVDRYDQELQLIMLTLEPLHPEDFTLDNQEEAVAAMSCSITNSLRNVDISTRFSSEQFLVILLNTDKQNVEIIVNRIFKNFYKMYTKENVSLSYDIADLSAKDFSASAK